MNINSMKNLLIKASVALLLSQPVNAVQDEIFPDFSAVSTAMRRGEVTIQHKGEIWEITTDIRSLPEDADTIGGQTTESGTIEYFVSRQNGEKLGSIYLFRN